MNRRKQVLFSTLIIYERSEFWKFFVLLLTLLSIEKTLKYYIKSSKLHCIYQDLHFKQPITNLVTYLFSIWRYFEKTKVCKIVSSFHPLHLIEKCYFSSSRKVLKGCNWVINVWWVKISSCSLLNLAQGEPNHQRKKQDIMDSLLFRRTSIICRKSGDCMGDYSFGGLSQLYL